MPELISKSSLFAPEFKSIFTSKGTVFIRVMTGKERDSWHQWITAEQAKTENTPCESVYCSLIIRTVCDEKGERIFSDADAGAVAEKMNVRLMKEIYDAALSFNILSSEAKEEIKKNSVTPNSSAGSV